MNTTIDASRWLPAAAGGPLAYGMAMALALGTRPIQEIPLTLLASTLGVGLCMFPALYVGLSVIGADPKPGELLRAVSRASQGFGTALLGLTPLVLFLGSTQPSRGTTLVLTVLGLGLASLVASRMVSLDAPRATSAPHRALAATGGWALVTMVLSASFFIKIL